MKGIVVDEAGACLASAAAAYPTSRSADGRAEQSPADWVSALGQVVGRLGERVPASSWAALGLTGMIPTLVTEDANGEPTGPAITWEDTRAQAEAERMERLVGPDALYEVTGQRVDGRYLLPVFLWIAGHELERARR